MELESLIAKENSIGPEEAALGLTALQAIVATCRKCGILCQHRTQTVFGVGKPQPEVVFVGEAPGADEDRQGQPFVGKAGQLLTKILEAAGLPRESVYICNVLKCRPPDNRRPLPDEVDNCLPFLKTQLAILRPRVIVALGGVAAGTLLGTADGITKLRGKIHQFENIPLICTFHPAFLLRTPEKKREVWDDMKGLLKLLGRPIEVHS